MNKSSFLNYRASVKLDNLEAHVSDLKAGQNPKSFNFNHSPTTPKQRTIAQEVKQLIREETSCWSRAKKRL